MLGIHCEGYRRCIKTNKSWWYLLHYQWHEDGTWTYGTNTSLSNKAITCKNPEDEWEDLKYLPSDTSKKMLGVYLTPDGSNDIQLKKKKEKAQLLAENVRSGHLRYHEAWIALTTMAMKSLEYPMPALTFTKDECKSLMWIILQAYLPKSGIHRKITRDVLYGDTAVQGLGLKDLFLTQGISHLSFIVVSR